MHRLSVDGHLACFHVLPIVNSAAVNIGVNVSFLREGNFYHTDILFFLWGMEKAPVAGYFIGVNQKIQLLIKITFQRQVKTAVRLGIKFRFSIMGF